MAHRWAGQYGPATFTNLQGDVDTDMTVTVRLPGTTTLATLFTDRTMTTTAPNPLPVGVAVGAHGVDVAGNVLFRVMPGIYDLLVDPRAVGSDGLPVPPRILTVAVPVDPQETEDERADRVADVTAALTYTDSVAAATLADARAYADSTTPVVTFRGEWSSTATYVRGDRVSHQGSSYEATGPVPAGRTPGASVEGWFLVAAGSSTDTSGRVTTLETDLAAVKLQLGSNPQGPGDANVRARLDRIDAEIDALGVPTGLEARVDALRVDVDNILANGAGSQGKPGLTPLVWRQDGAAVAAVGEPYVAPVPLLIRSLYVNSSEQVTSAPEFNVRVNGVELFTASTRPKIAAGQFNVQHVWPSPVSVPAGQQVRFSVDVAAAGGGSTATITPRGAAGTYESPVDSGVTSFTVPTAAGVVAGDLLIAVASAGQPVTWPAGWTPIGSPRTNASTNLYVSCARRTATADASDGGTATLPAGTSVSCFVKAFGGADTQTVDESSTATGDTTSTTFTGPDPGTVLAGRLILRLAATRYGSGTFGTVSHNGSGYTEQADLVSKRTGTNSNFGVKAIYRLFTADTPAGALTYTTSATGGAFRWLGFALTLRPAASSASSGKDLQATVWAERAD